MRWRARLSVVSVLCASLFGLFYFAAVARDNVVYDDNVHDGSSAALSLCATDQPGLLPVSCDIEDGTRSLNCYRDAGGEVFVPFGAFLRRQFDVNGTLDAAAGVFHWRQSYAPVKTTEGYAGYGPTSPFGPFTGYHVERRWSVRCVDAVHAVPMSVQWGTTPYYYPIQIAQYGLEHYSKNVTEEVEAIDEYSIKPNVWKLDGNDGAHSLKYLSDRDAIEIGASDTSGDATKTTAALPLQDCRAAGDGTVRTVLRLSVTLGRAASVSVVLHDANGDEYELRYVQTESPSCVYGSTEKKNVFHYAMGSLQPDVPKVFVRDLLTDINRALAAKVVDETKQKAKRLSQNKTNQINAKDLCIRELRVHGRATVLGGVKLASSAHDHMFLSAAAWFLHSQDDKGGWPVNARRSLADGRLKLEPGWYSAMAQGHAMSVLCRAYLVTSDRRYLDAALAATKLFDVDAKDRGIRNRLFDQFVWYEEYPTVPGSFVLNGFLYSMIGLYDLSKTAEIAQVSTDASRLFDQGVASLLALLPMYDLGGRTLYDLRHVSLGSGAPNVARWDYHALHVLQLRWLAAIVDDKRTGDRLNAVAQRWHAYARGERAKHN